jgi:RNA polymerase-binding protein DksA
MNRGAIMKKTNTSAHQLKDTVNVRDRLEKRRRELQDRLGRITTDVRHSQGLPADFSEQAVLRENDDVLDSLDRATRSELLQLERALSRLEMNQYGFCEICGQPISAARLEALPYVTLCLKCNAGPARRNDPRKK